MLDYGGGDDDVPDYLSTNHKQSIIERVKAAARAVSDVNAPKQRSAAAAAAPATELRPSAATFAATNIYTSTGANTPMAGGQTSSRGSPRWQHDMYDSAGRGDQGPSSFRSPRAPASSSSMLPPSEQLYSTVERCLAPAVKYYRQQDLGDLWLDMLREEDRPPWRGAIPVLGVLRTHSTTFWGLFKKEEMELLTKELTRFFKWGGGKRAHHSEEGTREIVIAASQLMDIFTGLLKGLGKPKDETAGVSPDPSEIPEFVSMGEAKAALEEGIEEISSVLQSIST